jgi:hypothetical protein
LVLTKNQQIFEAPRGLPPSRGEHDHGIPLILSSQLPNVHPYKHPFAQKNEIEKIVQELLEVNVICPNASPYSSLVVMVLKKEGNWHMCSDFRAPNKLTIKHKFPIPIIDIS